MRHRLIIILYCFLSLLHTPVYAETDDVTLSVWANEAIVATYTYTYQDFLARQKAIAHYFTSNGWIAYSKALLESKLPESIQKNEYAVSAVATAPPQITLIREHYWQAHMPILVVYKNPKYEQQQILAVTIVFTDIAPSQGVRGFAIESLQTKVIKKPCECK